MAQSPFVKLVLVFVGFSLSAFAEEKLSSPQIDCSKDEERCSVSFLTKDGERQNYELVRDQEIFSSNATVSAFGKTFSVKDFTKPRIYRTESRMKFWGSANLEKKSKSWALIHGTFLTNNGVLEWKTDTAGAIRLEEVQNPPIQDVVLPLPKDSSSYSPPSSFSANSDSSLSFEDLEIQPSYSSNSPTPFFPGCYPSDSAVHSAKISIVTDYGYYLAAAGSNSTPTQAVAKTLAAIEQVVSVSRVVYLAQLNTYLQIDQVVIGNSTSALPLSRSSSNGTCTGATTAFSEFSRWNAQEHSSNTGKQSGVWALFSNCFSGIVGVSYVGSLCGGSNSLVTQGFWLTFSHELGHAFGATHSFENGVGATGGIMDYGDGLYNGVTQFHPNKRSEVCPFLSWAVNNSCPYFTVKSGGSCGDGIMSPQEDCECLKKGSKSCGACVNCHLTKKIACSSQLFVMRTSSSKDFVLAERSELANPSCCTSKGKLAPPKTSCNNGMDVCTEHGACARVCSKYVPGDKTCGFDTSGCSQGCRWNGQCRFDILLNSGLPISQVPDGTSCFRDSKTFGKCANSQCIPK